MLKIKDSKARFNLRTYLFDTPGRADVELFIAHRFAQDHGAQICQFMPVLLAAFDESNRIVAATGVRNGAADALFLEDYLDAKIEHVIQDLQHENKKCSKVGRQQIAEIGNLASINLAASRYLFRELFSYCSQQHYQWIVFTSCRRLRRAFERLNLKLFQLAEADETKLTDSRGRWGSYYRDLPVVLAGYIPSGQSLLERSASPVEVCYE